MRDRLQGLPRAASAFVAGCMFLSSVVASAPQSSWTCNHLGLRLGEHWETDLRSHEEFSSSLNQRGRGLRKFEGFERGAWKV